MHFQVTAKSVRSFLATTMPLRYVIGAVVLTRTVLKNVCRHCTTVYALLQRDHVTAHWCALLARVLVLGPLQIRTHCYVVQALATGATSDGHE